ncbi:galactoside alpha-(1,2)-fucosyltransferase 2-like isoform X2 [Pleurodeles waltl]
MTWTWMIRVLTFFFLASMIFAIFSISKFYMFFERRNGLFSGIHTCKVTGNVNETEIVGQGMWTVAPAGRFGNQMGEYATLYALAMFNGQQAYIMADMFNGLAPIFKITLPLLHKSVEQKVSWRIYPLHNWMAEEYKDIKGKFVKLTGYPWSWTFYHHIQAEIRREFSFHDFIRKEANDYLEKLKGSRKNVTYVGVHVRRGDYVHVMPNSWKGVVADKAYLDKAMAYFRKKYQEPVFVVVTNGMQWCKDNIDTEKGDVYFSGDGNESVPGNDFALLAHCNHTIMTIGSFGFWAAYLAGGETIYLNNFTVPGSQHSKVFHYDAIYLPQWIGISADLSPLLNKTLS